ncbi:TPA: glycosyltransferase family 2 protein [Enterococcus faecium]|nr:MULTISPECIES: glycosyltransferase family 2 protein [Enterococcus]EME8248986.1 glycosyltransferase family 2 protein [Enterococcus faecium]MDQ8225016.1 glycosyltransferase family 2 protein [Enterococcus faecium]MDQ8450677.1 glycosyltransferase family 2 protein [Enterococcus faecium]MDQ8543283.1 glycosyltransferase family 2 protein [Enterococcus faecium]MDQ8555852.1 glycosyltransferase family 2 protein [Enterococcus faecium]
MDLVTIIVTVYNGENTIISTINSILKQTYTNIEIIIIDDYSTDETWKIINNIAKGDSRVKIYKNIVKGRARALNLAIERSSGRYIANIDADDLSHPERIARQVDFLKKNKQFGFVSTDALIIFNDENPRWDSKITLDNEYNYTQVFDEIKWSNNITHSSIMIDTKIIKKDIFKYNESLKKVLDYDLWITLYTHGYHLANLNEKLVAKRIHINQSYESKNRIEYLKTIRFMQLNRFNKCLTAKDRFLIEIKFLYGLLPQKFRMKIYNYLARI